MYLIPQMYTAISLLGCRYCLSICSTRGSHRMTRIGTSEGSTTSCAWFGVDKMILTMGGNHCDDVDDGGRSSSSLDLSSLRHWVHKYWLLVRQSDGCRAAIP